MIHNVFTEKFNKIALSVNDKKRIKTADGIIWHSYRHGTGTVRVCKAGLMRHSKTKK